MGSRTSEVLSEIDQIRNRLDGNLVELETRLPPVMKLGRKAVGIAVGGGVGSGILLFALKRKRSKKEDKAAVQQAPVVVKVLPGGTVPVAIGAVAAWAGVRLAEAWLRRSTDPGSQGGDGMVRPVPARSTV